MSDLPRQPLQIQELDAGDYEKLSALHEAFFGVSRDGDFWRWKYDHRPEGRAHVALAKAQDGGVAGQTGAVDYRFMVEGTPVLGAQAQDIVILDAYRKGKTFFELEKRARELLAARGVDFAYGFSIEITRRISTRMLGFTDIGPIDKLVHLVDLGPYLQMKLPVAWLSRFLGAVSRPLLRLRLKRPKPRPLGEGLRLESVETFDARFDRLWEKQAVRHGVIASRSAAWLNWRYPRNPVQTYKVFALSREADLLGYLVVEVKTGFRDFSTLNVRVNHAKRGEIVDYLGDDQADLPETAILDALLGAGLDYFAAQRVDVISAWCLPQMSLFKKLAAMGFRRRETPHHLIVRKRNEVDDRMMDLGRWYITHGDKDHF